MQQAIEIFVGGLLQGSAFALVAIGIALTYRVTGTINLAQGAFVVLGALLMYTTHQVLGWPLWIAIVAVVVATTALGLLVAALVFEPGLRRLPPGGVVILTAGLLTLFEGASLLLWGNQPYQLQAFVPGPPIDAFGILIPAQAPWIAATAIVMVTALWFLITRTVTGKALLACAENPLAATLMGIDVRTMTIGTFAIASGIGALTGMAIGPLLSVEFDGGGTFTTSGFIAVTIGGINSFVGAIVGGLGLGLVEQGASGYISSLFSTTIALVVLLLALAVRPSGIISGQKRREDVRAAVGVPFSDVRLPAPIAKTLGAVALIGLLSAPPVLHARGLDGLLSSLVIAGIFFVALLGLDVLMGYCGQVSLGHAAFMATGAYTTAIAVLKFGLPPIVGVALGIVFSLGCATVLSLVTSRLRGHYLALATMAFGLLVDSLASGLPDVTGGASGMTGIPSFSILGFSFDGSEANYYLVWGIVIASLVALTMVLRSDFGRTLRAIRTDQVAAMALGIDVPRYKLYAFLIAAGFASVAGSLLAFDFHFLSPDMVGTSQSFLIVTMLVVGGEATLVGPVVGVVLLTLLPTVFQFLANYKTLASGLLLVLAMLYFPGGLYRSLIVFITKITGGRRRRTRVLTAAPHGVEA